MKKIIFFIVISSLGLPLFVSAEQYTINIKGSPRAPDGSVDLMYEAVAQDEQIKIGNPTIDNTAGFFEIKNIEFADKIEVNGFIMDNSINVFVSGGCFNHSFNIFHRNNRFEISDAYGPQDNIIFTTQNTDIDLGVLKEDRSNQVMVDSDIPVEFHAEDLSGNSVADTGGYAKFTGMSDSFKSNTKYKLILITENKEKIVKEITTGNYCESTRLIKRGSYFLTESFSDNAFPPIGFFRNIQLSILGFRMVVIVPLVVLLFAIIITPFLIIRRRKSSSNLIQ